LSAGEIILQRAAAGRPVKSLILTGLRGVGKTVLLNSLNNDAEAIGYRTAFIEAHDGKSFPELVVPSLRKALIAASRSAAAKEAVQKGWRALKGFIVSLKLTFREVEVGLSIDPEAGLADSGDLETDLPDLMVAIAEAIAAADSRLAIFTDELQYLSAKEFSALIMAMHRINQLRLPVVLIGAGLPQIHALAGNSKSYAERLFSFPGIGALDEDDAVTALTSPAAVEGARFTPEAIAEILAVTERYPYFLQQWGYEAWNAAPGPMIDLNAVKTATDMAIEELDQSFFKVRFDRCTPSEKRYMRALAAFGPGAHRSGDIADRLGVKVTSVAPTRSGLIKKGMIYSPSHGDTAFTVPLFDQYMRRVMPDPG
jgi:hypothetical protein